MTWSELSIFIFLQHYLEGPTNIVIAHVQLAVILDQEHDPLKCDPRNRVDHCRVGVQSLVEAQVQYDVLPALGIHACLDVWVPKQLLAIIAKAEVFTEEGIQQLTTAKVLAPHVQVLAPELNVLSVAVHCADRAQVLFQERLAGIRAIDSGDLP